MAQAGRDQNFVPTLLGVSNVDGTTPVAVYADPTTHRLLTDAASGAGTVTSVSVVTANGFAGTVATATTTPAITLTTTVTGILSGNGTAVSAASTTGSGAVVLQGTPTLTTPVIGVATGTSLAVTGVLASGTNGGTGGQLTLNGSTSGSGVIKVSATAGAGIVFQLPSANGSNGNVLSTDGAGVTSWIAAGGTGTVTSVSVVTANGVSGSVATATTTPAITLTLGAITPTSIGSATTATTQAPADNSTKLATTAYVDSAVLGQNFKQAVKYATTAALAASTYSNGSSGVGATLTEVGLGALVVDGSTPSIGDRILIKNQASTFQNGIYTVTVVGSAGAAFVLTRGTDFDQTTDINSGDSVFVTAGTAYTSTTWAVNSASNPVLGTDAITFAQTAGQGTVTAGNGITVTGLSVAIDTAVTVDKTTAQTLTNKTLTSPNINEAVALTTTATKLNYLTSAGGTTGTTSTNIVFSTSPSLTTPTIGVATATSINKMAITAPATSSTLAVADGKTLTASNTLTLAGTDSTTMTFPTTSATIARTDAANTFAGIQTITNITLPDQGQIKLTVPTTDLKATGPTCGDFNCGYSSSAIGDLVYLDSSSTWQKCDANTLALYNGFLGIALEVKASANALLVALPGSFVYSTTGFPTWTIGSPIYMSETAGAMTQTAPTTTDSATRVVGWGVHADKMYFFPSPDYITHT